MNAAKAKNKKEKLPAYFKPLFWSYKFSAMDPSEHWDRVIVNTLNYGNWQHWQWIVDYYGKRKIKAMIREMPSSEFREGALRLACLLLGIRKMKYATRGIKIRAKKNL